MLDDTCSEMAYILFMLPSLSWIGRRAFDYYDLRSLLLQRWDITDSILPGVVTTLQPVRFFITSITIICVQIIFGASLSEPHTSERFRRVNHVRQKRIKTSVD